MELVEAVVRFRECDSVPPQHLLGWVSRHGESWRLDPVRMLEAGSRARAVWIAFDEWRRNWEQRWLLGEKGELLEMLGLAAALETVDLSDLPVDLGADAQVRLASIAAEVRDLLEAGSLPGWLLRGDDSSVLRGQNRVLISSSPRLEMRPDGMTLDGVRVHGWKLEGRDASIVFSDGTRLDKEQSQAVQRLLPGAATVHIEHTILSAPWAHTAGQVAKACVTAVSQGATLRFQLAE